MAEPKQQGNASMDTSDPGYRDFVTSIFHKARFIRDLGITLKDIGPGWCETSLAVEERHLQQDGFVHAGVLATMADHTAGASSGTIVPPGTLVLTIEFKINFLRPARTDALRCRADILKPGRSVIVAESAVYARHGDEVKLVAKAMISLAVVAQRGGKGGEGSE